MLHRKNACPLFSKSDQKGLIDMRRGEDLKARCKCFIQRIAHPSRRSKRVILIPQDKSGLFALTEKKWLRGALMTTALRAKPGSVSSPVPPLRKGALGYSIPEKVIETVTQSFIRDLRRIRASKNNYQAILKRAFENLEREATKHSFFWTFGRSQKYFNILTKYYFAVATGYPSKLKAKDRLLVGKWQNLFHAPIDSITLRHVKRFSPHLVKGVYWGWNMTACKYRDIQLEIKELATNKNLSPVAYEIFAIW